MNALFGDKAKRPPVGISACQFRDGLLASRVRRLSSRAFAVKRDSLGAGRRASPLRQEPISKPGQRGRVGRDQLAELKN
ncbi:hypothetical protein ACNRBH_02345 [Ralstonia pseudosolanacearum]|uniref:hypothetical protein n=1 Tax=Ralstonia pseudosolanacearum TaxID=1310165 RepID=UPI002675296C|nr:hypothetical protein [Ralstonia pseudosolanacearum]MDO3530112.1 hypothetical protein [Ralstonia pseudosolanacearum]MDO3535084.1 hypothetical protein [Ralstonia pseudosolanacearum]